MTEIFPSIPLRRGSNDEDLWTVMTPKSWASRRLRTRDRTMMRAQGWISEQPSASQHKPKELSSLGSPHGPTTRSDRGLLILRRCPATINNQQAASSRKPDDQTISINTHKNMSIGRGVNSHQGLLRHCRNSATRRSAVRIEQMRKSGLIGFLPNTATIFNTNSDVESTQRILNEMALSSSLGGKEQFHERRLRTVLEASATIIDRPH